MEPVAVLTEIRMGQGEVQVKFAGEADWMAPQLLLALQPGDQLRAAGDGQAMDDIHTIFARIESERVVVFLDTCYSGAADLKRDGIVSLQELYEYVEQQVTQKSRAVGGNQHPVMKGELEGVLPLVKVKGRP